MLELKVTEEAPLAVICKAPAEEVIGALLLVKFPDPENITAPAA
jgi:hypothetical protein